jgi:hypothetical protein
LPQTLNFISNVFAAALYPLYRLFDAYAESKEIDWDIVSKLLNHESLEPLFAACACLGAAKKSAEQIKQTTESTIKARAIAFGAHAVGGDDQLKALHGKYYAAKDSYDTAKAAKDHAEGVKSAGEDLRSARDNLYSETGIEAEGDAQIEAPGGDGARSAEADNNIPMQVPNLQIEEASQSAGATLGFAIDAPPASRGIPISQGAKELSSQPGIKIPLHDMGLVSRELLQAPAAGGPPLPPPRARSLLAPVAPPRRNPPVDIGEA